MASKSSARVSPATRALNLLRTHAHSTEVNSMPTLWMQLECELAESRGIDLRWLASIAPETARRWREDNVNAVHNMMTQAITR